MLLVLMLVRHVEKQLLVDEVIPRVERVWRGNLPGLWKDGSQRDVAVLEDGHEDD
jgi:hypothetical protein